jgi:aminoglycoside 6'-N-acetyltransferase
MSSYSFRPIARSDFPMLCGWLVQPHVLRWWADDATQEGVEADYGGVIDGTEPCEVFIAHRDGAAIGLAQRLQLSAYPSYADEIRQSVPVPPGAWSIDYLVGEGNATGRGWGAELVAAFTRRLWLDEATAACIIVPVHADNRFSWRALERSGYTRIATGLLEPDNPADNRKHYLYRSDGG